MVYGNFLPSVSPKRGRSRFAESPMDTTKKGLNLRSIGKGSGGLKKRRVISKKFFPTYNSTNHLMAAPNPPMKFNMDSRSNSPLGGKSPKNFYGYRDSHVGDCLNLKIPTSHSPDSFKKGRCVTNMGKIQVKRKDSALQRELNKAIQTIKML